MSRKKKLLPLIATALLCGLPGLALAGSYVAGVSVTDSLASGVAAAERVLGAAAS